jgi:hypothetical protein
MRVWFACGASDSIHIPRRVTSPKHAQKEKRRTDLHGSSGKKSATLSTLSKLDSDDDMLVCMCSGGSIILIGMFIVFRPAVKSLKMQW